MTNNCKKQCQNYTLTKLGSVIKREDQDFSGGTEQVIRTRGGRGVVAPERQLFIVVALNAVAHVQDVCQDPATCSLGTYMCVYV